jgi:hypothetical protein
MRLMTKQKRDFAIAVGAIVLTALNTVSIMYLMAGQLKIWEALLKFIE